MDDKKYIRCTMCNTLKQERYFYKTRSYKVFALDNGYMPACKKCMTNMFIEYMYNLYDGNAIPAIKLFCIRYDIFYDKKLAFSAEKYPDKQILGRYLGKVCTAQYYDKRFDDNLKKGLELNVINAKKARRPSYKQ